MAPFCCEALQRGVWMPAELKYGAVMVGHTVADEGRRDPARTFGVDVVGRVQTALCLLLVVSALTQVLP